MVPAVYCVTRELDLCARTRDETIDNIIYDETKFDLIPADCKEEY